jgi:hypothetical protein
MIPKLLTAEETAKLINVPLGTLQAWRIRRQGPPFYKFGKGKGASVRYAEADVLAFIDRSRIAIKGDAA